MIVLEQYAAGLRESGDYRGFPLCALVEDDQGDRWLLTDLPVPEGVWVQAVGARAKGMLLEHVVLLIDDVELLQRGNGLILPGAGAPEAPQRRSRPFVHLHAHSHYSSLDGLSTITEMIDAVAADGQEFMALTDHGVCAGHLELQKVATKKGIKPIFGIEAYLVNNAHDKDKSTLHDYFHFILLAQTEAGLRNLWRASTMAHSPDRFYGRPRMDWEILRECNEGLIASTACLRGPLAKLILDGHEDIAQQAIARLQAIFGDRLFLEMGTNHINEIQKDKWVSQLDLNKGLVSLSQSMSVPLIVVGDSHYSCAADQEAHQVWIAAQTDKTLQDEGDLFASNEEYHLHSGDEAFEAIRYLGDDVAAAAVAQTVEVAKMCDVTIKPRGGTPIYHRYEIAGSALQGMALDDDRLVKICEKAWTERLIPEAHDGGPLYDVYKARLDEEVAMLVSKKFCGYMLIVWDYCAWCREHKILVGPGRGSAAGSLVCYLMGITQIDPIEAGLLFERFISPGRTQLPDIDSDFPASKRTMITDYIVQRWGIEHVVRVGTVTRLRNKGVFREVARVLKGSDREIPYLAQETVSAIIDHAEAGTAGMGLSWDDLWNHVGDELQPFANQYPDWVKYAGQLVGRIKSYGKHPAGVVIDPIEPITDLPLRQGEEDHPVTEFPMDQLDELGLVKFDILTVRTLDTVQEVMDLLDLDDRFRDHVPHPHTWRQEYTDPAVWDMLCAGDTLGVFQIETPDGTRMTKEFQPRGLADLSAIGALVRPGPKNSGLTASYMRRRSGDESVTYAHPLLAKVLSETYGCMIYQEDIMNATKVIAGYTSAEADEVRSILGKKKIDKVAEEGKRFRARSAEMGIDEAIAERMFEQMAEFARYSFNKCISGVTRLSLAASGPSSDGTVTVEELYRRLQCGGPRHGEVDCPGCGRALRPGAKVAICSACRSWQYKFRTKGLFALALHDDGRIRPSRVVSVWDEGERPVWTMTLASGATITSTANHRHLTARGFIELSEIQVGDTVICDGGYEIHQYGPDEFRTTVGERQMVGSVFRADGADNYGYVDGGFASLTAWTRQAERVCRECGHDGSVHRLERAHLDGDRTNNDWDNLAMMCVSCHKSYDYRGNGRERRWGKGHVAIEVEVVSIEYVGEQRVYDVEMEAPHNFVANGVVTHNSHSWSYAVVSVWTAWFKANFPAHFLVALLSTADKGRFPDYVGEARHRGYRVDLPDVNESVETFKVSADNLGVRYGLSSIKGLGPSAAQAIIAGQPYTSWDDFLERRGKSCNWGHIKLLAEIGALDSLIPDGHTRVDLQAVCEQMAGGVIEQCSHLRDGYTPNMGVEHCCGFDWANEVVPLGVSGKPTKRKPPPKKCTKGCRQYVSQSAISWAQHPPLSAVSQRRLEREVFGLYVSSTPFDGLNLGGADISLITDLTDNDRFYVVLGEVQAVRERNDSFGRRMAFLTLMLPDGNLEVVAFSKVWEELRSAVHKDSFGLFVVRKNSRGFSMSRHVPIAQE